MKDIWKPKHPVWFKKNKDFVVRAKGEKTGILAHGMGEVRNEQDYLKEHGKDSEYKEYEGD